MRQYLKRSCSWVGQNFGHLSATFSMIPLTLLSLTYLYFIFMLLKQALAGRDNLEDGDALLAAALWGQGLRWAPPP